MTTLVVGANGATGRLLVEQLLAQGETVRIIVRSTDNLPELTQKNKQLTITESSVLNMTDVELNSHVQGCNAVVSCLGHNLNLKGMYGHPRRLVTDSVKRLCQSIEANKSTIPNTPVKFILMNTTGNKNSQASEKISMAEVLVIGLIRFLLPPHADNEAAAKYLQSSYGESQNTLEWVSVRPDALTNELSVTEYDVHVSPIRSAIFDSGKTSRINVAHFMSQLISNHEVWNKWKTQMPVIYNAE